MTAVATFYTMYRREPTGTYHVGVCTNSLCAVMGGDAIHAALREHLGIGDGETTPDGAITLEHIECNAACDFAPVMMVNWEFFDNRTPESATAVVDALRAGERVTPTRGAPLSSFRDTARILAGFPDRRQGALESGGGAGPATLAGLHSARSEAATPLTPVLSSHWDEDRSWTLDAYHGHDGYTALRKALRMNPDEVIQTVKDAGLRGRGGAGFPTGMKWSFIPQDPATDGTAKPHYLVVNADESEPGTCKDIPLMFATPHTLIEGVVIAAYAIRAAQAFVYVRGEVVPVLRRLQAAVAEAYDAGYLGRDILGSGYDLDIVVHAGAGAYICGEETALLDSLEGRRGQPRLRPPFPAVAGLYASPTVVNNVESIASVPPIILRGPEWFRGMGSEASPGFTLYSLSGHVTRPGQYEAPLGITLRQLLDVAGGVRAGHRLKFWTRAARRRRSSPTNTSTYRSTTRGWRVQDPCSAPRRCRSSTRRRASCGWCCAGRSSTRTSPAASAPRAVRAPTGSCRSSSASSAARAVWRTSRSCSTSRTRSSASRSVRSVTARPARSCRR